MEEKIARTKQIFQVVCVVEDLDATVENWKKYVDFNQASIKYASTRELIQNGVPIKTYYHGAEIRYDVRFVRFDLGGIDFMLVEPENKAGGDPYSDYLKAHGPGYHHISVSSDNREEAMEKYKALGYEPEAVEICGSMEHCLYHFENELGLMLSFPNQVVGPLGPRNADGKTR